MPKNLAVSETEICRLLIKICGSGWITWMRQKCTQCVMSVENIKNIFVSPLNDTVNSQLQLSFDVPHVFSLTKNVQVVNIQITMHSVRQLI